jgi:hypothetical protein
VKDPGRASGKKRDFDGQFPYAKTTQKVLGKETGATSYQGHLDDQDVPN